MKKLVLITAAFCLLFVLSIHGASDAVVTLSDQADITGDGSSHALGTSGFPRIVILNCPSTNSAAIRIGASTVSSSRGLACAPGGTLTLPFVSYGWRLSTVYYLAGVGDKLQVVLGN